jgi:polyribonucleotide nucleotidyltransferase
MKSLASITVKEIETIKMALNDSISDMNSELKSDISDKKKFNLMEYKAKYSRVYEKLRQNGSLYALNESELDTVAAGLNDAIEMIEDHIEEGIEEDEREEFLAYKEECLRLVDILST